jgi:ABC-2 type transport system permease protein
MVIVSLFFFVKIPISISVVFYTIVLIFLSSFFMAGLCYSISLILPNEVMYETVMNAIVLPIFFLSTALFPANSITGALGVAINLNPFTHVINALRSLILYRQIDIWQIAFVMALFVVLGCISFAWAHYRLQKETNL